MTCVLFLVTAMLWLVVAMTTAHDDDSCVAGINTKACYRPNGGRLEEFHGVYVCSQSDPQPTTGGVAVVITQNVCVQQNQTFGITASGYSCGCCGYECPRELKCPCSCQLDSVNGTLGPAAGVRVSFVTKRNVTVERCVPRALADDRFLCVDSCLGSAAYSSNSSSMAYLYHNGTQNSSDMVF
jgi:hypothetical protein